MSIIDKLKENVERVTGLPFVYGSQGDINRALDRAPLPCVFAYLIDTSVVDDTNGYCREQLTLALFFVDKTTFDFESLENERIIDAMKRKALKWYAANLMWQEFEIVRNNGAVRVYDEIVDAIVTGYGLNVTIKETEGVGRCGI